MKLVWTHLALEDLNCANEFISNERPSVAQFVIHRIEKALSSVSLYPQIGRNGRVTGTREIVVTGTPFIIPYRIKEKRIEILAIIHRSRCWPGSL